MRPMSITFEASGTPIGGYREWRARGAAARLCEAVWVFDAGPAPSPHRLLPDGKPSLLVRISREETGRPRSAEIRVSAGGGETRWYRPEPYELQVAIRLLPEISASRFGICLHDYKERSGAAPKPWMDRLASFLDSRPENLTGFAFSWARTVIAAARDCDDTIEAHIARLIRRTSGRISVDRLAGRLGVSVRHIRRRFETTLGLSPKAYARLMRQLNAVRLADSEQEPDWADIASACGYYDQSHMIRDIRTLTGVTPAVLLAERRAESVLSNTQV